MDLAALFFPGLIAVGIVVTIVLFLKMAPLPPSADNWLRIIFLGLAALFVWSYTRDGDGGRSIVLVICIGSGILASFVTTDRGQAAVSASCIAMLSMTGVGFVLGVGDQDYGVTSWPLYAIMMLLFAIWLALIPAGIAGWLAADARSHWDRRLRPGRANRAT